MPVFGKALVRPEVIDGGSYVHLMELQSLNVQHSVHKSRVTPGTLIASLLAAPMCTIAIYIIHCTQYISCTQIKMQNQFLFCIHKQLNNNS